MKKNQDVYLYSLHRDAKDILNDGSELMVVNNDEERYNVEGDWSEEEFGGVDIGDKRLHTRLLKIGYDFYSMKKEIVTNSEEETLQWAEELGKRSKMGNVYALHGELGAGKTIIAKGIAKGLGIEDDITSPSFILLEIYPNKLPLYHFDLYRIDNDDEFDGLCFEEYWRGDGISVIEWAEKAGSRLPESSITIKIEWLDSDKRRIVIEYPDD